MAGHMIVEGLIKVYFEIYTAIVACRLSSFTISTSFIKEIEFKSKLKS